MTQVSVVIPSRNRWPRLRHAVACALRQRDVDHEVIVALDGSGDESEEALRALGDDRLSVLSSPEHVGIARTRNAGIAAARGEWIAFLDDDDRWSPDKLSHALQASADRDFVYGPAVIVDDDLRVVWNAAAPAPGDLLRTLLVQNLMPAGSSNVVVRRELIDAVGGFDELLVHLADWDLWIRLAAHGRAGAAAHTDVACFMHDSNLSLTNIAALRRDFGLLQSRYARPAAQMGVQLNRALFERWVAMGQRRTGHRVVAARILLESAIQSRNVGNAARAAHVLVFAPNATHHRRAQSAPAWLTAD